MRVLKRTFGNKTEKETVGGKELHNEKLHNLYSASYIRMT
jgi:hypothetical protein